MGLHRPAEFNRATCRRSWPVPRPEALGDRLPVRPVLRVVPAAGRGAPRMLVEHGMMGREYDQVLSNTVAAFALGDYEWLLALEADELHDTVDLMRHLRYSGARCMCARRFRSSPAGGSTSPGSSRWCGDRHDRTGRRGRDRTRRRDRPALRRGAAGRVRRSGGVPTT